jgi:tetratricopeptide (TPR) repeat protein
LGGSRGKAEEQARDLERRHPTWGALAWAAIFEEFGPWEQAARSYERAAARGPLEEEAYLRWTWLLQSHERFADAFRTLDALQRQLPSSALGNYERGRTAAFSGLRLEEGRRALALYLEHAPLAGQPSAALTHFHLGMIRRHEGRNDLAQDEFRRALELDPFLQEARQNLQELAKPTPTN